MIFRNDICKYDIVLPMYNNLEKACNIYVLNDKRDTEYNSSMNYEDFYQYYICKDFSKGISKGKVYCRFNKRSILDEW